MRSLYFILCLLSAFTFFSCSNEVQEDIVVNISDPSAINNTGEIDGVIYSLNNVVVSPSVISLNEKNSTLISSENNLCKVEITDADVAAKIVANAVLYYNSKDVVLLKTIKNVKTEGNILELTVEDAGLGDLFTSGSIEMSVDIEKAEKIINTKSNQLKASNVDNSFTFDVFNFIKEYKTDDFAINLNSSLKTFFNVKIGFNSSTSKAPNEIVVSYEMKPTMNPYFSFKRPVNQEYNINFIELVPESLLDLLKSVEVNVDLPIGDLGTVPATVSIKDIQIPTQVIANIYKAADLKFAANGSFKIGYAYYNQVPGKKSHIIYENGMTFSNPSIVDLSGEVTSDAKVVIVPKIRIINETLLGINGEVIYGLKTESNGGIEFKSKEYKVASKGDFYSSGVLNVSSLGIKLFSVDLFQTNKELWSIGTFDRSIILSNLKITKPSKSYCALRSYSFDMTVDYQYPIIGKKISNEIEITYDVYDDAKKLLSAGQVAVVNPSNVTDKSFSFTLCVPFKVDALAITSGFTKKTGYIRNIKIKDAFQNEGIGITNLSTGAVSSEIALGSPYNTSFWK